MNNKQGHKTGKGSKNATNHSTEETSNAGQKRRGPPPGPRRVVFLGFALNEGGDVLSEEVVFENPAEATEENATKEFRRLTGADAAVVRGPYREVRTAKSTVAKRQGSIPLADLKLTANRISGQFNGWNVVGHYVEGHPNKVLVMFDSPIDQNAKKRQPRGMQVVDASSISGRRDL